MRIKELFEGQGYGLLGVDEGTEVLHLTHDSREVYPGSLFFAIKGGKTDGKMFALNALSKGAVAIVTDEVVEGLPNIIVKNPRKAMALVAKKFYNNACDRLKVIGITGTNGKTTTTHIITHILNSSKVKAASIGTLGPSNLTTPDPIELHRLFKEMSEAGVRVVVMECSAHAIALNKLAGISFEVGIFTNLSQDHLDFFQDYRHYADTKLNWFDEAHKVVVVNADDTEAEKIKHPSRLDYSLQNKIKFTSPLMGKFNRYNILAAIKTCRQLGLGMRRIRKALKTIPEVPGRFNTIKVGGTMAVIDYAHTPDSLENIINTCKELTSHRVITVFGCGGERDIGKRPLMGQIAGRLSDYVVITSDNPRTEPPKSIMLQIEAGVKLHTRNYKLVEDRGIAINYAFSMAKDGDIIIIAGKGDEDYLDIGGKKVPYSDKQIIDEYLAKFDKN
ncbi:MAG: UDP-N-acetylmuramoyl-L-alanyl-D-glutamate--2,6-diaminopimelate ligase [Firmicutes bacterium]|nr:UDP-N-acetylmuramoyl-L-alanyl-D-glutamate--2,6-diaminopimelate ligase [Bacillota bacterium]